MNLYEQQRTNRRRTWLIVTAFVDPDPNAFATGRNPEHASIAVTRGLLDALSREELQGVVAHELSHVRNFDIRVMTMSRRGSWRRWRFKRSPQ